MDDARNRAPNLNGADMKIPIIEKAHAVDSSGIHKIYRFENGYGASVVRFNYSYGGNSGLWELAVIKFEDESNNSWSLDYETPVTGDVIGYLTEEQVEQYLEQIEALSEIKPSTTKPIICHKHG